MWGKADMYYQRKTESIGWSEVLRMLFKKTKTFEKRVYCVHKLASILSVNTEIEKTSPTASEF